MWTEENQTEFTSEVFYHDLLFHTAFFSVMVAGFVTLGAMFAGV